MASCHPSPLNPQRREDELNSSKWTICCGSSEINCWNPPPPTWNPQSQTKEFSIFLSGIHSIDLYSALIFLNTLRLRVCLWITWPGMVLRLRKWFYQRKKSLVLLGAEVSIKLFFIHIGIPPLEEKYRSDSSWFPRGTWVA